MAERKSTIDDTVLRARCLGCCVGCLSVLATPLTRFWRSPQVARALWLLVLISTVVLPLRIAQVAANGRPDSESIAARMSPAVEQSAETANVSTTDDRDDQQVAPGKSPGIGVKGDVLLMATQAWDRCRSAIPRLLCEWEETQHIDAGSLADWVIDDPMLIPEDKWELSFKSSFLLDGVRMRYTSKQLDWTQSQGAFVTEFLGIYDGTRSISYKPQRKPPQARLVVQSRPDDVMSYHLLPIILAFRATDRQFCPFDANKLVRGAPEVVEGRKCEVLSLDLSRDTTLRLSVDPRSDFAVRRYETRSGPTIKFQATIDYSRDKKIPWLWIPCRWTIVDHPMPNREVTIRGVLVKCAVDPAIDKHAFEEPEYATGTEISRSVRVDNDEERP